MPLVAAWRVDRAFDYVVPPEISSRVAIGSLVRIPLGRRNVRGVVVGEGGDEGRADLVEVKSLVVGPPVAPGRLVDLFTWIAERYTSPRGTTFARAVPPRIRVAVAEPAPLDVDIGVERLTRYRRGGELLDAVRSGTAGAWCIQAEWGEDRGALIAELVGAAVPHGAALVAVPEVRYGSKVLDTLVARLPALVRIDSSTSDAARARGWLALAAGHPLGAGGRAAVLAPAPVLRLLVVDDEHHPSYKEDRSPRYDARRVALERARLQGGVCVLVSATPSLEFAHEVTCVEPERDRARAARPIVEVVPPPVRFSLAPEMQDRIRETLRSGGRAALVVPRRGYASAIWCRGCRRSLRCPVCEAGLVLERAAGRVRCVRCGRRAVAPSACPACTSQDLRLVGAGSERLEEQLARAFPRHRVARMDPEVLASGEAQAEAPDIYVTTWVGTKPALRPDVSLVGMIGVDHLLRRPDFRAAESAYQALVELAEWAGPAGRGGRLLVQTAEPGHHALQAVVRADHSFFAARELAARQELRYPPFSELVKVRAAGEGRGALVERAADVCRAAGGTVLGPIALRVRSGDREHDALEILVKSPDAFEVASALRVLLAGLEPGKRLYVDVDPA